MKTISILGSTGSIGCSALEVISLHPDKFQIFALSGYNNDDLLYKQALDFNPNYIVTKNKESMQKLSKLLKKDKSKTEVLFGVSGYKYIAGHQNVSTVLASITGAAGLASTMEAAEKGKQILLANKESMVMAGKLLTDTCLKNGGQIIPVDSEHNAIFQVIHNQKNLKEVKSLFLTASGGPFRKHSLERLRHVTVADALKHPNWDMGRKVTIDSATMMNKGLEVIEAAFLFKLKMQKIKVLIHPQSIIHSLVEFSDGSTLTQLGNPDMRVPIAYALGYPARISSGVKGIDLTRTHDLQFEKPDLKKFKCLSLAYQCLKEGGDYPIVLNAANEVAVEQFLAKRISFIQIPDLIERVLDKHQVFDADSMSAILEVDKRARTVTRSFLKDFKVV
jgi:1-deoxy-D-xylulose-5-phosphate reductoisomerase